MNTRVDYGNQTDPMSFYVVHLSEPDRVHGRLYEAHLNCRQIVYIGNTEQEAVAALVAGLARLVADGSVEVNGDRSLGGDLAQERFGGMEQPLRLYSQFVPVTSHLLRARAVLETAGRREFEPLVEAINTLIERCVRAEEEQTQARSLQRRVQTLTAELEAAKAALAQLEPLPTAQVEERTIFQQLREG